MNNNYRAAQERIRRLRQYENILDGYPYYVPISENFPLMNHPLVKNRIVQRGYPIHINPRPYIRFNPTHRQNIMNFYKIRALLEEYPPAFSARFRNLPGGGAEHMKLAKRMLNTATRIQKGYRSQKKRANTARKRLLGAKVFSAFLSRTYRPPNNSNNGGSSYKRLANTTHIGKKVANRRKN